MSNEDLLRTLVAERGVDVWITDCSSAESVHTKFIGVFALDVQPAAHGYRADVRFKHQDGGGRLIGFYPDLDTAKAQAPRDMRAQLLESLAEIAEAS